MKRLIFLATLGIAAVAAVAEPIRSQLAFDPKGGDIHLPPGFRAVVVADNLGSCVS